MSDFIKHECGIALIRLLKPLSFYQEKYGSAFYGLNKLYLLMEKQRNRGQDGAGVATIKLDMPPGSRYISRHRSISKEPIRDIFNKIYKGFEERSKGDHTLYNDAEWLKGNASFTGELLLGHLRYGTHGKNSIEACHPFLRQNNWMTRNLITAGNFNLTNVDELFNQLVDLGQHPKEKSDNVTVLEKFGHFLDEENQKLFNKYKKEGHDNNTITQLIADNLDLHSVLVNSAKNFDGGYAMVGLVGHGDAFVLRDPSGIRPAFKYIDDEVVVVASERPAIQTVFDVSSGQIEEIEPGHALIVKKNGSISEVLCKEPLEKKSCSFERIYFSRGNDQDIYKERINLGKALVPKVLEAVEHDIDNTVFSFIPNTAEVSFYGLIQGLEEHLDELKAKKISQLEDKNNVEEIEKILNTKIRSEKIAIKDAKFRTFISEDSGRDDLVTHAYDITYGVVKSKVDNLVVIDDSIVRGTTLKQSIIRILDRLEPKRIIVVSSAPQIRYPDCYGIDMSKMKDFIAFRAAVALLEDSNKDELLEEVYQKSKAEILKKGTDIQNFVSKVYEPFSADQISDKIAELLTPNDTNAEVRIVYQSIESLHEACPDHSGDWYFSGNYPTPGGNRVVNKAFINYMEGSNARAY